jgi:hypothetical protein
MSKTIVDTTRLISDYGFNFHDADGYRHLIFFWKNVVTAREKDPAGSIIVKGAAYGKRKRSH